MIQRILTDSIRASGQQKGGERFSSFAYCLIRLHFTFIFYCLSYIVFLFKMVGDLVLNI